MGTATLQVMRNSTAEREISEGIKKIYEDLWPKLSGHLNFAEHRTDPAERENAIEKAVLAHVAAFERIHELCKGYGVHTYVDRHTSTKGHTTVCLWFYADSANQGECEMSMVRSNRNGVWDQPKGDMQKIVSELIECLRLVLPGYLGADDARFADETAAA
jgi:hypothetical protein